MRIFNKYEPLGNVHLQKEIIGNTVVSESYQFRDSKRVVLMKYTFDFPIEYLDSLIEELYHMGFEEVISYESWRQSKAAAVS